MLYKTYNIYIDRYRSGHTSSMIINVAVNATLIYRLRMLNPQTLLEE